MGWDQFQTYAKNGYLEPYAENLSNADQFYPALKDAFTYDGNLSNPTQNVSNWVDVPGLSQVAIVSGSNSVIFNVNDAGYSWFRIHYTNTAGTGSFLVYATGKTSG